MRHRPSAQLPPGHVRRRGPGNWPSRRYRNCPPRSRLPRSWWIPPDPGSLLAGIIAHTGEPLWKEPMSWTQAHLDFFSCRFEKQEEASTQPRAPVQKTDSTPSSLSLFRRSSSIMSSTSKAEKDTAEGTSGPRTHYLREAARCLSGSLNWKVSRAVARTGAKASDTQIRLLSLRGEDDESRRRTIKRALEVSTGLDFRCKELLLWLLVDGYKRAPLEVTICVPSVLHPARSLADRLAALRGRKSGKVVRERDEEGVTGPTPKHLALFPGAALVGETSKAVTLIRGLSLGSIELCDIQRLREERYPYWLFEAMLNAPTAAVMRKQLRDVTPAVRQHDPYLLAVMIAMAQVQEAWRAELKPEEAEILRQNGEEWLCDGGFTVHLIVTDERDRSGLFVYGTTVPPSLLDMLRYPRRAPRTKSSCSASSATSSDFDQKPRRTVRDEVVIRYQKVPYHPAQDFSRRLMERIEAGCTARKAWG